MVEAEPYSVSSGKRQEEVLADIIWEVYPSAGHYREPGLRPAPVGKDPRGPTWAQVLVDPQSDGQGWITVPALCPMVLLGVLLRGLVSSPDDQGRSTLSHFPGYNTQLKVERIINQKVRASLKPMMQVKFPGSQVLFRRLVQEHVVIYRQK